MTVLLTGLALVAFAANSLLCRAALGAHAIDPASFTLVRLASGAVLLAPLVFARRAGPRRPAGSRVGALLLFSYAAFFSFAYTELTAGTGALLLFGAVQTTMLVLALAGGDRPGVREWAGLVLAVAGLVVLVLPGLSAPPLHAALFMVLAGASWGFYSVRGRGATDPLALTAGNFAWATLPALVLSAWTWRGAYAAPAGISLAAASGALASGLGYVAWYAALPRLSATRAAIVQLTVPVLAAVLGMAFLGEHPTVRLGGASALILGGVALAVVKRPEEP